MYSVLYSYNGEQETVEGIFQGIHEAEDACEELQVENADTDVDFYVITYEVDENGFVVSDDREQF